MEAPPLGTIGWFDLTVPEAQRLRDFYREVVGWSAEGFDMGGYEDYVMKAPGGQAVAGICHARGPNANVPPQWLLYVIVADLDASLSRCDALGGKRLTEVRRHGEAASYCVIQDSAGAVLALYCPTAKS